MRILAVDDKATPRKVLAGAIAEAAPDAEVVACSNAGEVLALPDASSFDVAFLDIGMPGMNGIELARRLKALNPRVNVVFATGYGEYMADAFAMHSSGYVMKPVTATDVAAELENLRFPPAPSIPAGRLYVRCFGDFEVYADGKPITFGRTRARELFAYLVDRRGAMVALKRVEAALWEGDPRVGANASYLRTLISHLKVALDDEGYGDVLLRRRGEIGIDTSRIVCDYYDYLRGDPAAVNLWQGEYMEQYSWAEPTKAALLAGMPDEAKPAR